MVNTTGRPTAPLVLSSDEREYLTRQVRRHRVARSMSERCRIILRCGDGLPSKAVAAELGVHEHTVGKWRRRFLKDRVEGLLDEMRPGRPRTIDDDQIAAVIERTLRSASTRRNTLVDPLHGWSSPDFHTRRSAGSGRRSACSRIASSFRAIRSSSTRSAILSASICRRPTGRWSSVSMRKARIQALDREQPVLPMMLGVPERRTHSYIRHGTTSLFAALDVASGFVIPASATGVTALPSSSTSSSRSTLAFPKDSTSTSSWTTTLPIKRRRSRHGWRADRTIMRISRQHPPPGSTRSNAGSPNSPARSSGAASIPRPVSSKPISAPSSSATMKTPGPISGSNPPTRFSPPSSDSARRPDRHYVANFRFT